MKTVPTSLPATPSFPRRRESSDVGRILESDILDRSVGFAHGCGLRKYWSRQGDYVLPAKPAIFSDDGFSQIKRSKIN